MIQDTSHSLVPAVWPNLDDAAFLTSVWPSASDIVTSLRILHAHQHGAPQVRLDSFAKFLAPGLRLGWVTAAAPLVEKLTYCIHGSSLGACATTQASRCTSFWLCVHEPSS